MRHVRRLLTAGLATFGVLAGVLAPAGSPALAAAPEKPETKAATGVTATTAMLNGVLNPGAKATAGWYFAYSTEPTCLSALTTTPEAELEVQAEPESREVTELQPNKTYEFCLVATGEAGAATTQGNELSLTTSPAPPKVDGESVSEVTSTGAKLEAQVNPNNEATTYAFEYSTKEAGGVLEDPTTVKGLSSLPAEFGDQLASVTLTGLEVGTTYYYRVVAENGTAPVAEGAVAPFATSPTAPHASTGAVSAIGQSSANVTGTVTPEGAETYYYYQYGPTTEYGQSTSPEGPGITVGAGTSAVQAPAILVPLTPGVSYHYRLVAWNEDGTSYGQDETFTTEAGLAPLASTGPASGVSVSEATISGTINPQGKETSYRFEYGTNTEYGTQAFGTVLPEQGEQTVTLSLRGLEAGTTYHYRLVVSNPGGEATGADATFTTPPIADPLINPAVVPLIATPAIAFPAGSQENTAATKTMTKKLTSAQKLAKALKACTKQPKRKRATCEKQARSRYGTEKKRKK